MEKWVGLASLKWLAQTRILRSGHFWLIFCLVVLLTMLHYVEQLGVAGTTAPSSHFGFTRHSLDRTLFLLPIVYSQFVFGFGAALATSFAALLIMLPRAIFISPHRTDAIVEVVGVLLVGVLVSLMFKLWEQARLDKQLAQEAEKYRRLLQHTLNLQEQERKRMARELHDETSQVFASLSLSLQAAMRMAQMKGIQDAEYMEKLKTALSYTVQGRNEVAKLIRELRPALLDELGLPAAIRRYATDTLEAQGIHVSIEFIGMERRLPPEVEVAFFRIAQGTIGNILEHSGAKNASIKLESNAWESALYIEDDGKGFDASKLTQVGTRGRGIGLFIMKERATLVGGICRVESQPGQGTKISVKVPLVAEKVVHEKG